MQHYLPPISYQIMSITVIKDNIVNVEMTHLKRENKYITNRKRNLLLCKTRFEKSNSSGYLNSPQSLLAILFFLVSLS